MRSGKFFTPVLDETHRWSILASLGLSALSFRFVETAGATLLRHWLVTGASVQPLLTVPPAENADSLPTLHWDHASQPETPRQPRRPSLWEDLLPYPYSLLGRHFAQLEDGLRFSEGSLQARLREFWQQLEALDAEMGETELTCLWLAPEPASGGDAPIASPLLLHYVRRRRVRVGSAPGLAEVAQAYRSGSLDVSALRDRFGTSCSFLPVSVLPGTPGNLVPGNRISL